MCEVAGFRVSMKNREEIIELAENIASVKRD